MTQPRNTEIDEARRLAKIEPKRQRMYLNHVLQRAELQMLQAQEWVEFYNSAGELQRAAYWSRVLQRRRILLESLTSDKK